VACAAACAVYGFWDPRFFAGLLWLFSALMYWLTIRWVDQHGSWTDRPDSGPRQRWRGWAAGAVAAVALGGVTALIVACIFFNFYVIPQDGMYPGLPAGSRVLAVRRPYRDASEVKRGDIVIFNHTEDGQDYLYIWRVIGLPGDALQVSDEAVVLNGKPLPREVARLDGDTRIYREANGEAVYEVAYGPTTDPPPDVTLTVPAGNFFVLGDNRRHAVDSRYLGPVPFDSILAKKW
jgi:signal peptidase I